MLIRALKSEAGTGLEDGAFEEPFDFIGAMQAALCSERVVPPPDLDTTYRASGLSYLCEVQEVLCHLRQIKRVEKISAKQQITFDFGTAFHSLMQDKYLGRMNWLEGDWRCFKCDAVVKSAIRPQRCSSCGSSSGHAYVELELSAPKHFITGHPDGILVHGKTKHLLELKTCNSKTFAWITENRRMPLDAHLDQANIYMFLLGIRRAIVVYFNKDTSDMISFNIMFDQNRVDAQLGKIRNVKNGIKSKTAFGLARSCSSQSCARALSCAVRADCIRTWP